MDVKFDEQSCSGYQFPGNVFRIQLGCQPINAPLCKSQCRYDLAVNGGLAGEKINAKNSVPRARELLEIRVLAEPFFNA